MFLNKFTCTNKRLLFGKYHPCYFLHTKNNCPVTETRLWFVVCWSGKICLKATIIILNFESDSCHKNKHYQILPEVELRVDLNSNCIVNMWVGSSWVYSIFYFLWSFNPNSPFNRHWCKYICSPFVHWIVTFWGSNFKQML